MGSMKVRSLMHVITPQSMQYALQLDQYSSCSSIRVHFAPHVGIMRSFSRHFAMYSAYFVVHEIYL